ncbi:MAG TPA: hypothetical protein VMB34_32630 [Acetobacteraceae bacterium]|nr:hypothetical protein [Acetobacteraceae bacterium]
MPTARGSVRTYAMSVLLAWVLGIALPCRPQAMEIAVWGDQLVLSGPVVDGDFARVQSMLARSPAVTTVILRDSPGGDARTGYQLGEEFRARHFRTAVSGYCFSSCSRMFLGGAVRLFTDDSAPDATEVGLHGHYDSHGRLASAAVRQFGLKDWIIRFSDGKADPALVERWINIPVNRGMIHFFNPALVRHDGVSTFMCQGPNPPGKTVFDCEPIAKTAIDLGIATSTDRISSNDFVAARRILPKSPAPSGYATVGNVDKVPLATPQGRNEYRRFLAAPLPRAFAIAPDQQHWAWNSGIADAMLTALVRCAGRAGQQCRIYAFDDTVIWTGP